MQAIVPWINKYRVLPNKLSIKRMTILGFFLVIFPLLSALIYLAEQTKSASDAGANAIIAVSSLVEANQDLQQALTNSERFASQFIVLKEDELLTRFTSAQERVAHILKTQLMPIEDDVLQTQISLLTTQLAMIANQLPEQSQGFDELAETATAFKGIAEINARIRARSDQLIQQSAQDIRNRTKDVDVVIYQSLLIIPVSLLLAGIFIYLISQPLKTLVRKIALLEQGDFNQRVAVQGSSDVKEIAKALDTLRVRLHALELQKSSFIRHISHELKTPLAAIREGSALLNDNSLGRLNAGQQEVSQIIIDSVNRLQQLIEDLLAFNIVLDSTSLQDSEQVQVAPLVEQIVAEHKLALQKKALEVTLNLKPIQIQSNRKQLSVILENLISNAIKYVPAQGQIQITAAIEQSTLVLSVADNGQGISPTALTHIFDAFYQGESPASLTDTEIKSSGLGLTIVQELVMRLNGDIQVDSRQTESDHGTCFTITLPRAFLQEELV